MPRILIAARPNVNDELKAAGLSFGKLIESTGLAVAETQNLLNDTGAETASALATTMVEVNAVHERTMNDAGQIIAAKTHTRSLPLLTLIDPVFYKWTSVRLQGSFLAREVTRENQVKTQHAAGSLSIDKKGLSASGSFSASSSQVATASDTSLGSMRLYAQLEPRRDVGIPKPTAVIQGPRLELSPGSVQDEENEEELVVASIVNLTIVYDKQDLDGKTVPIALQKVSIDTAGMPFVYLDPTKLTEAPAPKDDEPWTFDRTNGSGQVMIRLRRRFPEPTASPQRIDLVVAARVGLVANNLTVKI
ncbi:MAG: hypothetical protein ACRDKW_09895 [Actinomycetota bacterium]